MKSSNQTEVPFKTQACLMGLRSVEMLSTHPVAFFTSSTVKFSPSSIKVIPVFLLISKTP